VGDTSLARGIFFDVSASEILPLSYIEIHSVWVRGELGPVTVWTTPDGHAGSDGRGRVGDQAGPAASSTTPFFFWSPVRRHLS